MSSLAKRIKKAADLETVYSCLDELQALLALAKMATISGLAAWIARTIGAKSVVAGG
jgi:hypothetical protein